MILSVSSIFVPRYLEFTMAPAMAAMKKLKIKAKNTDKKDTDKKDAMTVSEFQRNKPTKELNKINKHP